MPMHVDKIRVELEASSSGRPISSRLVINGVPLNEQIAGATKGFGGGGDCPLGWMPLTYQQSYVASLTAEAPATLPNGRCELLICSLCGDLGCGYVSCLVHREGEYVIWKEMGYENGLKSNDIDLFPMGRFRFRGDDLKSALAMHIHP